MPCNAATPLRAYSWLADRSSSVVSQALLTVLQPAGHAHSPPALRQGLLQPSSPASMLAWQPTAASLTCTAECQQLHALDLYWYMHVATTKIQGPQPFICMAHAAVGLFITAYGVALWPCLHGRPYMLSSRHDSSGLLIHPLKS